MLKKYLLVLSGLQLGGAERQAVNFAKYLKETGQQVVILGLTNVGRVNKICEEENIKCISIATGSRMSNFILSKYNRLRRYAGQNEIWVAGEALMIRLAHYIKKEKFDVCISYCTYANTILGCSKKYYSKPIYVWYQRDAGIFDSIEGYQKDAAERVDYILANSRSGQQWIYKAYQKKAEIIRNGIIPSVPVMSRTKWREKMKVSENTIVCTMIANLSEAKNHMELLKIWRILKETDCKNKMILVLAGRFDNQYNSLLQYVNENALKEQVLFLGEVIDVSGLIGATDICVFGAKSEGSPNGIIEAEMAGLPVVATDLPEIREVVAEENYRYLFPRNNIEYAVKSLMELANSEALRRKIGLLNKKKVESDYSYKNNFNRIISLVENLK